MVLKTEVTEKDINFICKEVYQTDGLKIAYAYFLKIQRMWS